MAKSFCATTIEYPGKSAITLIFFRVTAYEGDPQNLIYREMRWEPRENLAAFDFVAGDGRFLAEFCS